MHMYGCELWNLNDKKMEAFRIAWQKIKHQIWKLLARAHTIIVHNLSYSVDVCLDIRINKFVYNALNHFNEICHNLRHTKLNCMRSTFKENYQYLSYKYQLSDRAWYNDLEHFLGKIQIKFSELFLGSPTASNVVECLLLESNMCVRSLIYIERTYIIYIIVSLHKLVKL